MIEWRITARHTPIVLRRCPRCDGIRSFISSDKFRINASGRKLDVWLIYRCRVCKQTWNAAIVSRVTPESLDPVLYRKFLDNDRDTAWRYAFDYELLKKNEAEHDPKIKCDIQGPRLDTTRHTGIEEVRITFTHPIPLRLETLLAKQFGISRSKLEKLHTSKGLVIDPAGKLSRKVKSDVRVTIDLEALSALRDPTEAMSEADELDETE